MHVTNHRASPRGPRAPAVVQSALWLHDTYGVLDACRRRYGHVFTLRLGKLGPVVVLTRSVDIQIFMSWDRQQADGSEAGEVFRPFVGDRSVLLTGGDAHRTTRRELYHALHGDPLAHVVAEAKRQAEQASNAWRRGEAISGLAAVRDVVLRTLLIPVVGVPRSELDSWQRQLEALMNSWAVNLALFAPLQLRIGPWATLIDHCERLDARLHAHIRARRDGGATPCLQVLLGHDDDRWVRDQLMTLLVAGYDTTASTLAWLLYYAPGGGDVDATAVVKETLRLRPVVPLVVRRLLRPANVAGHALPAGTMVGASVYSVHRDAELYPRPHDFDATRFTTTTFKPHEFIPFGGGHRVCLGLSLGMRMMTTIAQALRARGLRRAPGPEEQSVRRYGTLVPKHGVQLVVS